MTLQDLTDGGKAAMAEALAVLESAPEKLTAPLMKSVTAVLLESEDPERWQIFFAQEAEQQILSALQL